VTYWYVSECVNVNCVYINNELTELLADLLAEFICWYQFMAERECPNGVFYPFVAEGEYSNGFFSFPFVAEGECSN